MHRTKKQVGERFEKLVLAELLPGSRCRCVCDCGQHTVIALSDFRRTRSCGCFRRERIAAMSYRHGKSRIPEYAIWHLMKDRCLNPNSHHFKFYGGRGITVCERWLDFANFYADMGPRPIGRYSLERSNNSAGYAPENCRWGTFAEQVRNRRTTRMMTAFGKTQCVTDWAKEYGLEAVTLFARLRRGVPLEAALTLRLEDKAGLRRAKQHL